MKIDLRYRGLLLAALLLVNDAAFALNPNPVAELHLAASVERTSYRWLLNQQAVVPALLAYLNPYQRQPRIREIRTLVRHEHDFAGEHPENTLMRYWRNKGETNYLSEWLGANLNHNRAREGIHSESLDSSKSLSKVPEDEIHRVFKRDMHEGAAVALHLNRGWEYYFGSSLTLDEQVRRLSEAITGQWPGARKELTRRLQDPGLLKRLSNGFLLLEKASRGARSPETLRALRVVLALGDDPVLLAGHILDHAGRRGKDNDPRSEIASACLPVDLLAFVASRPSSIVELSALLSHIDFHLRGEPHPTVVSDHPYSSMDEFVATHRLFDEFRRFQREKLLSYQPFLSFEALRRRLETLAGMGMINQIAYSPEMHASEPVNLVDVSSLSEPGFWNRFHRSFYRPYVHDAAPLFYEMEVQHHFVRGLGNTTRSVAVARLGLHRSPYANEAPDSFLTSSSLAGRRGRRSLGASLTSKSFSFGSKRLDFLRRGLSKEDMQLLTSEASRQEIRFIPVYRLGGPLMRRVMGKPFIFVNSVSTSWNLRTRRLSLQHEIIGHDTEFIDRVLGITYSKDTAPLYEAYALAVAEFSHISDFEKRIDAVLTRGMPLYMDEFNPREAYREGVRYRLTGDARKTLSAQLRTLLSAKETADLSKAADALAVSANPSQGSILDLKRRIDEMLSQDTVRWDEERSGRSILVFPDSRYRSWISLITERLAVELAHYRIIPHAGDEIRFVIDPRGVSHRIESAQSSFAYVVELGSEDLPSISPLGKLPPKLAAIVGQIADEWLLSRLGYPSESVDSPAAIILKETLAILRRRDVSASPSAFGVADSSVELDADGWLGRESLLAGRERLPGRSAQLAATSLMSVLRSVSGSHQRNRLWAMVKVLVNLRRAQTLEPATLHSTGLDQAFIALRSLREKMAQVHSSEDWLAQKDGILLDFDHYERALLEPWGRVLRASELQAANRQFFDSKVDQLFKVAAKAFANWRSTLKEAKTFEDLQGLPLYQFLTSSTRMQSTERLLTVSEYFDPVVVGWIFRQEILRISFQSLQTPGQIVSETIHQLNVHRKKSRGPMKGSVRELMDRLTADAESLKRDPSPALGLMPFWSSGPLAWVRRLRARGWSDRAVATTLGMAEEMLFQGIVVGGIVGIGYGILALPKLVMWALAVKVKAAVFIGAHPKVTSFTESNRMGPWRSPTLRDRLRLGWTSTIAALGGLFGYWLAWDVTGRYLTAVNLPSIGLLEFSGWTAGVVAAALVHGFATYYSPKDRAIGLAGRVFDPSELSPEMRAAPLKAKGRGSMYRSFVKLPEMANFRSLLKRAGFLYRHDDVAIPGSDGVPHGIIFRPNQIPDTPQRLSGLFALPFLLTVAHKPLLGPISSWGIKVLFIGIVAGVVSSLLQYRFPDRAQVKKKQSLRELLRRAA